MTAWLPLRPPPPSAQFFVSYRSFEARFAEAIENELIRRGQGVWRDRRNLFSGDDWWAQIRHAIAEADDVLVLLTEQASQSDQVFAEVQHAVALEKRVHCFAAVELSAVPRLYSLVKHLNIETLPAAALAQPANDLARTVVDRVFRDAAQTHPLDPSVFERMSSRQLYPPYSVLRTHPALIERYLLIARDAAHNPARRNAANLLSAGVLALHARRHADARTYLAEARAVGAGSLADYFCAFAMLDGIRPRRLGGKMLDACLDLAGHAFRARPSPLSALLLAAVAWDSGRARGPKIAAQFVDAARALSSMASERDETARFMALLPSGPDSLELPVRIAEFERHMQYIAGSAHG